MSDFLTNASVAVAGRVNANREIITQPNYLRWLAQGKVFEAGLGPEDAEENSQGALDDTKATFALQSTTATGQLCIPLFLNLSCTADGGALSNWCVAFTRPAAECATAMTISGTALTFKRNMNREYTSQGNCSALYGDAITVSALTNADYVGVYLGHAIDAVLTSGLVAVSGASNQVSYNFIDGSCGLPHILSKGAAMLVYIYTGTSDSVWRGYMQWAEVTVDDLL